MAYEITAVLKVDKEFEALEAATEHLEELWESREELVGFAHLLIISVVDAEDGTLVISKDVDGTTDVFT